MGKMNLKKTNHRHDQIAEWLVINGDKTLTECARHFKYTLPWVSQMVSSDMFQALYIELCNDRKVAAVHTISNKMSAAANLALDKVLENLKGDSLMPSQALETAESMLDRLGFSPKANGNGTANTQNTQNNYYLTPEALIEARERAREGNSRPLEIPLEK